MSSPVQLTDPIGLQGLHLKAGERCIVEQIHKIINHLHDTDVQQLLDRVRVRSLQLERIGDLPKGGLRGALERIASSEQESKQAVAEITLAQGYGGITLGYIITTGEHLAPCNDRTPCRINPRHRGDMALLAHELQHVVQYHQAGEAVYLVKYLDDYSALLKRGASDKAAYRCIPSELEAYALQATLLKFFSDRKRLESFSDACCAGKDIPDRHKDIIKSGYNRRLSRLKTLCARGDFKEIEKDDVIYD